MSQLKIEKNTLKIRKDEFVGKNYVEVDIRNVEEIKKGSISNDRILGYIIKLCIYSIMLLGFGFVLDFDKFVGGISFQTNAEGIQLDGILSMGQTIMGIVSEIDQYLISLGCLTIISACILVGIWWMKRIPTTEIVVAGDDNIHLPRDDFERLCDQNSI